MIYENEFVVLTDKDELYVTTTKYLIQHNLSSFLNWHCEVFDHTKTITQQFGITGYTACGSKSTHCNIGICGCPTDIAIPKAISQNTLEELKIKIACTDLETIHLQEYDVANGDIVACGEISLLLDKKFFVDWNLLKRCNFNCSYCAPDIHDFTSEYPSFESIKETFDNLNIPEGKRPYFHLQGGEPTIHPNLFEIVDLCCSAGEVEIVTNGTATIETYSKLLDKVKLNFSLHHELVTEKHMKKFVDIVNLNKGKIIFKYFNTFDTERFAEYLELLDQPHVRFIRNKRLILRGKREEEKSWAT